MRIALSVKLHHNLRRPEWPIHTVRISSPVFVTASDASVAQVIYALYRAGARKVRQRPRKSHETT